MKVLTVKQPWATAIIKGWKTVENRSWAPPSALLGKRIAIHSSASERRQDFEDDCAFVRDTIGEMVDLDALAMPRGAILGTVKLVEVVTEPTEQERSRGGAREVGHLAPWFFGPLGWVLSEPEEFEKPVYTRGALGLWEWRGP
jgi:hypothetical protein